ncbi:phospholipid scramblase 2-like isoform X3 [Mixophyes fleayi]|uniref:phospholipid scramblase 2-like isoform X1 n=1 Tax=Mixophyes fleayi TaxID=3061075 RepID=UPI003F4E05FB
MASGHYNFELIQTQPQWQNKSTSAYQDQLSVPTAVVPPGLECLVEVEEVILKRKVFQTNSGQTLFSVHWETECCGPALNLKLRDPYKRDVVLLYLVASDDCCGGQTYLRIETLLQRGIGYVTIDNTSRELNVSIQMANKEPVFTARMPVYMDPRRDNTIEILSVNGNHPVVQIEKEKEHKSSQVIFRFPLNMDASLKAVILAAFLYMTFRVNQIESSSFTNDDSGRATADYDACGGGIDYGVSDWGHDSGHCGGGSEDWGGDGGGNCGGGGGGDCGGDGGDCGGDGGDCGGGGGDCGGCD